MKGFFFKTMIVAGACLFTNQLQAQNLLTVNSGFETGKAGWYFEGANVLLTNEGYAGKSSLKLISVEGSLTHFFTDPKAQKIAFSSTKQYELKLWVKPLTKVREIELRVYPSTGFKEERDILEIFKGKALKLNEWQQITIPFKANDYEDGKFKISVGIGEILFDEISLTEIKS